MRLPVNHLVPVLALFLLEGCGLAGGRSPVDAVPVAAANGPAADYPVTIGAPFVIDGVTHTPIDRMNYDAVGYAITAEEGGGAISGSHKTLPLPSYVEVTSLESGKTIVVRMERRGPMENDHLIALSPGAAAQLGVAGQASAPVRVRRVNPPETERALLRSGERAPERMDTPKPLLMVLSRRLMPMVSASPTPAHSPEPSPVTGPVSGSVFTPDTTTAPDLVSTPVVQPMPEATAKPRVAAKGDLFVQIAAFSTKERADTLANSVSGFVEEAGKFWRVRTGPYLKWAEANAALVKVRAQGYRDARIQTVR